MLAAEAAPLSTWVDCAKAYLAAGKEDAFTHICLEGVKEDVAIEVERFFGKSPRYEQIQFHCALAALQMGKARETKDRQRRAEHLGAAAKSLSAAQLLDPQEQLVALGRGMLLINKGDNLSARQEFMRCLSLKNNGQPNIVGHLALAGLLFNTKQYKEALKHYCRALQENPAAPAEVRLGIAACHLRLGSTTIAAQAYERVLELDSSNADALLGLASIKFNSSNVQQGLADGLQFLVRAYTLDPTNVGTLVMLAHYCLIKGEHDKVIVLARSAMEATENDAVRAECFLYLARALHAKGMFAEASMNYAQAARLDPSAPLPHLGTAQMYLHQGNVINASTELETALKTAPAFFDALKILGQLIGGNQNKANQVLGHFRGAASKAQDDAGIWEVLGELSAATDPSGSLKAYRHALALHRQRVNDARAKLEAGKEERSQQKRESAASSAAEAAASGGDGAQAAAKAAAQEASLFGSDDDDEEGTAPAPINGDASAEEVKKQAEPTVHPELFVPARLLNNTAVLMYRSGLLSEARALLDESYASSAAVAAATPAQREALQISSGGSHAGEELSTVHRLALAYNCARLQEAMGELAAAAAGYEAILSESPGYIDCYLRLACAAQKKGNPAKALEWAQKALEQSGEDSSHAADAMALMSQLHMEQKDYVQASTLLRKLLGRGGKPLPPGTTLDSYAQLAYGNLMLDTLPDRKKEGGENKAMEFLQRALGEYFAVLQVHPNNAFAANGVGAVLAELGQLDDAQVVFSEVQAAVAASGGYLQIPDLYINMANVALAKQEYATALRLYKIAQEKLGKNNKQNLVLLYLSRAYYDSDDLQQAKKVLLKAIHRDPADYHMRFNVALTMQEWAVRTYRKARPPGDPTKLPEFTQGRKEIELAYGLFETLARMEQRVTKLDHKKLHAHVKFCRDLMSVADTHLEGAREEARKHEEERRKLLNSRLLAEQRKAIELDKLQSAQQTEIKRKEELAREAMLKAERLKEEWRLQGMQMGTEGEGGGGKKGKGSKKGGGGKKGARSMANDEEEASEEGGGAEPSPYEAAMAAAAAGGSAAQENAVQDDEDLFGSDSEDEGAQRKGEKELMDEAGLASEQEEEATPGGSAKGRERGGGRLKRARAGSEGQEQLQQGGESGLEDDDMQAQAEALEDGGDEEDEQQANKRPRKTAAFEDSDEEEGGGSGNQQQAQLQSEQQPPQEHNGDEQGGAYGEGEMLQQQGEQAEDPQQQEDVQQGQQQEQEQLLEEQLEGGQQSMEGVEMQGQQDGEMHMAEGAGADAGGQ